MSSMNYLYIVLGILCITAGILLIIIYNDLVMNSKTSGLSFKLRTAGYGAIILGVALIIEGF